ncbi:MAG: 16S rRNA (guanine(966)-N(2))-methyltransferase RsmD [Candidatus Saccharimonadales bacterium]
MRIIAGRLGGRSFNSPQGHKTHPMSDKVRGGLFNALGDIAGLSVLDAFSGSGAIGYEAVSRGASSVLAIESDRNAQRTIQENIKKLGLEYFLKLISAKTNAWLSTTNATFDIIICDPPYDDVQHNQIEKLAKRLNKNGLLILSLPPETEVKLPESFKIIQTKNYGDAKLIFYRYL